MKRKLKLPEKAKDFYALMDDYLIELYDGLYTLNSKYISEEDLKEIKYSNIDELKKANKYEAYYIRDILNMKWGFVWPEKCQIFSIFPLSEIKNKKQFRSVLEQYANKIRKRLYGSRNITPNPSNNKNSK